MWSRWVDDQFFNAQRTHMLCCDPRPLGRSLICRGVLFFARGWRGAVWGGFQPVADITTGITERALLDLKARCPKKWPRTPGQRRLAPPVSEGDRRALAEVGDDLELVHEPPDARQAEPEAPRGRVPVLHSQCNVGDPRPVVGRHDLDPAPPLLVDQSEDDRAAPGIVHNVSRELRDGCCDDSQVGRGKAALCRQLASLLAGNDDVGVRTYRHSPLISDACEPQWLRPCHSR